MCCFRQVKYHSPQQEHSFGCPYQLGHFPSADRGDDAMLMTLPVRTYLASFWQNLVDNVCIGCLLCSKTKRLV